MKNKSGVNKICFKFTFLILALFASEKIVAQGDIQLMPKRVVFEGSKKIEELNIINIGKDTARYSISIVQLRMKEDGTLEKITIPDSAQLFADQNIRIFPRTVTLAPNEAQLVKIQVIKTSQLAPGEYRSHLYFRALPGEKAAGEVEMNITEAADISFKLTPVFGITIPVIIRIGNSVTQVDLSELSLNKINGTTYSLNVKFKRTGNTSVYGDLLVNHVSEQGKITQLSIVRGIAVYLPNTLRTYRMDLHVEPGMDFSKGKLLVQYLTKTDQKFIILTESELLLNSKEETFKR